jgi:hypothetical protein
MVEEKMSSCLNENFQFKKTIMNSSHTACSSSVKTLDVIMLFKP